ncbi:MAG: ATP-dependent RNA helicase DbpA [Pseudomonadota bacterium]|nr:ATP-dependent RNA helicase DbpA [Pseudomonadota bacterium]
MSSTTFSSLSLAKEVLQNLDSLGYKAMTPIQAQSLPAILAGRDVVAQGKTGSGKTAAFGLGLLSKLDVKRFRVQILVLCPTRELADQVAVEIRRLARATHNVKVLTLCGGKPLGPQIGSLEHGAHIIVGTPGRVEKHLNKGTLRLNDVSMFVLDEADRMLEMGFQDSIDAIVEQMPEQRQTLLFSATYPDKIESIAKRITQNPLMVKVASTHENNSIAQSFYQVENNSARDEAVRLLLLEHLPESTVIFCNTKAEAQELADTLADDGFSALAIHGDLEQHERDKTLVLFANKSASILVATDVAARGLDIDDLDCVINYHVSRDPEVHVHRIGRTGRAGSKGLAFSLFAEKELYKMAQLEDYLGKEIKPSQLPSTHIQTKHFPRPSMTTLQIEGGKKQKIRPGDILGALTAGQDIQGKQVGKIKVLEHHAYVAVEQSVGKLALKKLNEGKLKGRQSRARLLSI